MSESPQRFIEDDRRHHQQCVTATGVIIRHNSERFYQIMERLPDLQEMLSRQQQRILRQQRALHTLMADLRRQEDKMLQAFHHLRHARPSDQSASST